MSDLAQNDLLDFECAEFFAAVYNEYEFIASIRKVPRQGPGLVACKSLAITFGNCRCGSRHMLANADHWADDSVFSRDLIDLAMQGADQKLLEAACTKAEGAYGAAVRHSLTQAVQSLRDRPHRLDECMNALGVHSISKAQLWQRIRGLASALPRADVPEA